MATNSNIPKRLRSTDEGPSEDREGKKQRLNKTIASELSQSLNVGWSSKDECKKWIKKKLFDQIIARIDQKNAITVM